MNRMTGALLFAAVAGAVGWWANHRSQQSVQRPVLQASVDPIDPKMIVRPERDIDPQMVKILPNVDPGMVYDPPAPSTDKEQSSRSRPQ